MAFKASALATYKPYTRMQSDPLISKLPV